MQRTVPDPLAEQIPAGEVKDEETVRVAAKGDGLLVGTRTVKVM